MGKGDRKTARGKRFMGSYGVTRRRKRRKTSFIPDSAQAEVTAPNKPAAAEAVDTPVKKKPAAKKTTAKKATKTTAAKTTKAAKETKETKETKESKEAKETKETKDAKED